MRTDHLTIGFVRRGFSASGGAEAYLKRLASGLVQKGHQVRLYASPDWPADEWGFGPIIHVAGRSPISFADEIATRDPGTECDVLMSLERIWRCDVYRAGDGVHRAWLERRAETGRVFGRLSDAVNRKHADTIALEESLLAESGADRVIANSHMVKEEIERLYRFPSDKIDVVYNGVPLDEFRPRRNGGAITRETLGLQKEDIGVLFAGSGWERKGLRYAIEAIEASGKEMRLIVAGRGEARKFKSRRVRFLDVIKDMPALYEAMDIFLLPTIYDPFSNACLEALAFGLPVITTRANGFAEIIQTGVHGSIIDDPRNTDAIRQSLHFWSDAARRAEARIENRALAERFDISANVVQTLEILTSFGSV